MKSLPKPIRATDFPGRLLPGESAIAPRFQSRDAAARIVKQRGVVLFFTLVALLAMSLAVVALIRSVDTSAMIAGNLAFRQSATTAGDAGIEAAMAWLQQTNMANQGINLMNNTPSVHPFNVDTPTSGYYSSLNPALNLTDPTQPLHINWTDADSFYVGTDNGGNAVRVVIQRACRDANVPTQNTFCLYGSANDTLTSKSTPMAATSCNGPGCPIEGQTPMLRITSRTEGPRNSVSYVQTFVY